MKPILHHCILQQHLQKYYVSRQRSHNPFLPSFVRRMAGYLVLSVPYTKYILLPFYLCIACHALTNYFLVFNPQKSCISVRSYASSKSAKTQYIRHHFLSDKHSQFFWLQNIAQHSLAFNKSSLTRGPSVMVQKAVKS
jgi:hypothetical protein